MSHEISYARMSPKEADEKAIADIREYLGPRAWAALLKEAEKANVYDVVNDGYDGWTQINHALAFCGVQGYPVHAFGRAYCLTSFKNWMRGGDDPVPVDEQGYPIATGERVS